MEAREINIQVGRDELQQRSGRSSSDKRVHTVLGVRDPLGENKRLGEQGDLLIICVANGLFFEGDENRSAIYVASVSVNVKEERKG